jgi:hypothetical protein
LKAIFLRLRESDHHPPIPWRFLGVRLRSYCSDKESESAGKKMAERDLTLGAAAKCPINQWVISYHSPTEHPETNTDILQKKDAYAYWTCSSPSSLEEAPSWRPLPLFSSPLFSPSFACGLSRPRAFSRMTQQAVEKVSGLDNQRARLCEITVSYGNTLFKYLILFYP